MSLQTVCWICRMPFAPIRHYDTERHAICAACYEAHGGTQVAGPNPGLPPSPDVERAIAWAVEWALRQAMNRKQCPLAWDAGFPGLKAQALLDYAALHAAPTEIKP